MKTFKECYDQILSKGTFNINAGVGVGAKMKLTCPQFGEFVQEHVESGESGCCLHFGTYLSKLLSENGIYNELIVTKEPTLLPDGKIRPDSRVSVMFMDENGKLCVANPVEDVEMFDKLEIPHNQRANSQMQAYVYGKKMELVWKLKQENSIVPLSAYGAKIPLEDFMANYANHALLSAPYIATMGNIFSEQNKEKSFAAAFNSMQEFSASDIPAITARFAEKQKNL